MREQLHPFSPGTGEVFHPLRLETLPCGAPFPTNLTFPALLPTTQFFYSGTCFTHLGVGLQIVESTMPLLAPLPAIGGRLAMVELLLTL